MPCIANALCAITSRQRTMATERIRKPSRRPEAISDSEVEPILFTRTFLRALDGYDDAPVRGYTAPRNGGRGCMWGGFHSAQYLNAFQVAFCLLGCSGRFK